jgi:hypothetical protein
MILGRFFAYKSAAAQVYIVHEPNGSDGADIIMRSLPKSRLLFLMRDGRDVIDSVLDSYRVGSWLDAAFGVGRDLTSSERLEFIETESYRWLTRTRLVQKAFDAHTPALRRLVRYEDLLADTSTQLSQILDWIGLPPLHRLESRVRRHAFDGIPKSDIGSGKFRRAASPGLWSDMWSAEEKRLCGAILDSTLQEYGYVATDA